MTMIPEETIENIKKDFTEEIKHKEEIVTIVGLLSRRDLLEQLAEEASELSKAALKVIRAEKFGKNITPVSEEEAKKNLEEEFIDVLIAAETLGLFPEKISSDTKAKKCARWIERLTNKAPSPEEFTRQMIAAIDEGTEQAHITMDELMCEILEQLGYGEGVKVFQGTGKWYS